MDAETRYALLSFGKQRSMSLMLGGIRRSLDHVLGKVQFMFDRAAAVQESASHRATKLSAATHMGLVWSESAFGSISATKNDGATRTKVQPGSDSSDCTSVIAQAIRSQSWKQASSSLRQLELASLMCYSPVRPSAPLPPKVLQDATTSMVRRLFHVANLCQHGVSSTANEAARKLRHTSEADQIAVDPALEAFATGSWHMRARAARVFLHRRAMECATLTDMLPKAIRELPSASPTSGQAEDVAVTISNRIWALIHSVCAATLKVSARFGDASVGNACRLLACPLRNVACSGDKDRLPCISIAAGRQTLIDLACRSLVAVGGSRGADSLA